MPAKVNQHRVQGAPILPRRIDVPDLSEVPLHWVGGDPFLSALFNALTLVFPPGERFFMESVRRYRDRLDSPELREAVRGFLGQEALHAREHSVFNDWLSGHGLPVAGITQAVTDHLAMRQRSRTPLENLAVTCALEHFTAIMAEAWLCDDEVRAEADPRVRPLWTWHAIEEVEHRAVAFDVYQAVGGDYVTRARLMLRISLGFSLGIAILQASLLRHAGAHRDYRGIARGVARLWGPRRGIFTRLIPAYLRYYDPRFHPLERDLTALLRRFESELSRDGYLASAVAA